MNRVNSFSLVELVVAMAFGGIVLMIGYGGYELFTQTTNRFGSALEKQIQVESNLSTIYRDFYASEVITTENGVLSFYDLNRVISYQSDNGIWTRIQNGRIDTMEIEIKQIGVNQLEIKLHNHAPIVLELPETALSKLTP